MTDDKMTDKVKRRLTTVLCLMCTAILASWE